MAMKRLAILSPLNNRYRRKPRNFARKLSAMHNFHNTINIFVSNRRFFSKPRIRIAPHNNA